MVKNKKFILGVSFIIALGIFAFLVSGVITTTSPLSGSNHSTATSVLFNVSFVNGTDILIFGTGQTQVNASFYTVTGSTTTFLTNSSQCSINACWTTFNVSGTDGFFNITSRIFNATTNISSSVNITSVYFDSTPPTASFTNPLSGGNYSQNLTINLSVSDATIGVQAVIFNITNATNVQNFSSLAVRESSTSNYAFVINTTAYPDGYYNLTIRANDSLNNLNTTTIVTRIIFDNTLPTASFTCEDYTVEEDEQMDCDCTATDALSNISSISFDSTPSTSTVGDNQQSNCTVTDRAGNIKISSILYDVSEASSSTGSSSSGSSSGTTGGTTTGSSSSGNSTNTNNTTQNSSSGEANQLQANQQNQNEGNFKINYWVLTIIIVGAAIIVTVFVLIKKGILQRVLKFNK